MSPVPGARWSMLLSQTSVVRPTEEVAAFFARGPSVEEFAALRLSDQAMEHIRELLDKNAAGALSPEVSEELDELAVLDRLVPLIQSRLPRPTAPST
jgi:hypothetical protein